MTGPRTYFIEVIHYNSDAQESAVIEVPPGKTIEQELHDRKIRGIIDIHDPGDWTYDPDGRPVVTRR